MTNKLLSTLLLLFFLSAPILYSQSINGQKQFPAFKLSLDSSVEEYLTILKHPEVLKAKENTSTYRPEFAEVKWSYGDSRTYYEYNDQNSLTSTIMQVQSENSWVNFSKMNYSTTYDLITGDILYVTEQQIWSSGVWINANKFVLRYSTPTKKHSDMVYQWIQNQWVATIKTEYYYNGELLLDSTLSYIWSINDWALHSSTNYEHDSKGKISSEEYKVVKQGELRNTGRNLNSYDDFGNIYQSQYEVWNDSTWVPESRHTHTYNYSFIDSVQKRSSSLYELMDSDTWKPQSLTEFIYNDYGARLEELTKIISDTTWINGFKTAYSVDANGNNHFAEVFIWENDAWVNSEGAMAPTYNKGRNESYYYGNSVTVEYEQPLATESPMFTPESIELVQNYPNPFNPSTNITVEVHEATSISLAVYNSIGEQIAVIHKGEIAQGTHRFTFDASYLTSGVYFAKLENGNSTQIKKMMLVK